jgi:hypothetical protein
MVVARCGLLFSGGYSCPGLQALWLKFVRWPEGSCGKGICTLSLIRLCMNVVK